MIIAVAVRDNKLDPPLHLQFGRCPWFALYDSCTGKTTYLRNTKHDSPEDAGSGTASLLVAARVSKVVAGRIGIKAAAYLRDKQVQMVIPHKEGLTLTQFLQKIDPVKIEGIKRQDRKTSCVKTDSN